MMVILFPRSIAKHRPSTTPSQTSTEWKNYRTSVDQLLKVSSSPLLHEGLIPLLGVERSHFYPGDLPRRTQCFVVPV